MKDRRVTTPDPWAGLTGYIDPTLLPDDTLACFSSSPWRNFAPPAASRSLLSRRPNLFFISSLREDGAAGQWTRTYVKDRRVTTPDPGAGLTGYIDPTLLPDDTLACFF